MQSSQGLANFPANKAKITLDINGAPHPVLAMQGEEAISAGFHFDVEILTDKYSPLTSFIGASSALSFAGQDGIKRTIIGVVTKIHEQGGFDDTRLRIKITLESTLSRLRHQTDTRIILGHAVPDIIKLICERHGIGTHQLKFDLSQTYPVRPYTLQANESDWDFLYRLTANAGIYWYSVTQDNQEVIVFTDHNAHCPYIAREVLSYIPETGSSRSVEGSNLVGIYDLSANARAVAPQIRIHDYNEETPTTSLLAGSHVTTQPAAYLQDTPQPGETRFGLGTRTLDDSAQWCKRQAESAKVLAFDLTVRGNVVDMAAGHVCSLDAQLFDPGYSGDCLITRVSHRASQYSSANLDSAEVAYRHDATCIKRETPFRCALVSHPPLPMTLTARIESDGPYARLDEQGKYQIRTLFDLSSTRHTQASIPLRRLTPYGGLPNESYVGLHTPLQDGAEVLISCLNGDPDRPVIVGTVPNPDKSSPVTSKNPSQNRLRTQADNELCMDDTKEKEAITLRTYSGFNILHLDATAMAHKVRLATQHGAMSTWAKKTILRQSDDTMTELVGNDRTVIVENMHRTETKTKEIHHQAATDHRHSAHNNYRTESGKNTELQTGRNLILDVADNTTITVKGSGGLFATVRNSEVFLQCANKIDIQGKGGGDITFEQSGGGFKVDAGGNVRLYGNKVFVGGSGGVKLNGKVNYSVPGPQPPGAVNTRAPLKFAGILNLVAGEAEPSIQDLEIQLIDEFDNQLANHLKMLDGIKYRLETDLGDVREGEIKDGKIREKQINIKSQYHLEFNEVLPFDTGGLE